MHSMDRNACYVHIDWIFLHAKKINQCVVLEICQLDNKIIFFYFTKNKFEYLRNILVCS